MYVSLSTRPFHRLLFVLAVATAAAFPAEQTLAQTTWINAASGGWNVNANWDTAVFPDAMDVDVVFDAVNPAANSTITLTADVTVGTITINNPTTSLITGQTITFNDSTSAFIAFENGNWTIDSNIQLDTDLTLTGGSNGTIGGVISDGAANNLIKSGDGTVTLEAVNTLTGTASVTDGTLVLNGAGGETLTNISQVNISGDGMVRLGSTGRIDNAAALVMSGNGSFDLDGFTEQVASLSGTSNTSISLDGGHLVLTGGDTTTFAGTLSGAGTLTHGGAGMLTLSGVNPFTGTTNVTDGILRLATGGALGATNAVNVSGDGILRLATGATINNTAGVTLSDTATFDLDGNTETIGTLDGSANTSVTLGSGGHLQVIDNADSAFAGEISGDGSFAKSGTGLMQLAGANTYTGSTRIDGGVLRLDAINALGGTSSITLNNDAVLRNNAVGSVINDDAALTLNDTSRFELNGDIETIGSLAGGAGTTVDLGADTLTTGGNNASTTYSGVITGAGGLTKNGAGTFSLNGGNTYTGPTTINNGRLNVNGSVTSAVTATSGSTLGGTGTVLSATINNGATVDPGTALTPISTLTFDGNGAPAFTQLAGSTYEVDINDGGTVAGVNNDLIDLTAAASTASLDGTVSVFDTTGGLGNNYAAGSTYTILQTANPNGMTGMYTGVTDNLFLRDAQLFHNPDSVEMQLFRVSGDFEAKGMTRNQMNVGEVLDEETPFATGDFGDGLDLLVLLALTDPAQIPGVLDTLGGEIHASVAGHMVQQSSRFVDMISRRMRANSHGDVGMYGPTVQPGAPMLMGSAAVDGIQRVGLTDAGDFVVRAQGIGSPAWGSAYGMPMTGQPMGAFWVGGYGVAGDVDGDGNGNPYDYDIWGTTFGVEQQVHPALLLGLAGGYGRSQVDMATPNSDADVDSYHAGIYGHFNEGIFYSTAVLAYGFQQYDTTRQIPFFGVTANADYDGQQFIAYGEKGLNLCFGGLRVQPLVGLQFIALERDAFTESGAGPFNLVVNEDHVNSLRMSAGGRIAPELPPGYFGAIIPEFRGRWVHEFMDDDQTLSAAFAGGGNNFAVTSAELGRNFGVVGAGLTAQLGPMVNLYLDYDYTFSSSLEAHAGSGGLEFLW